MKILKGTYPNGFKEILDFEFTSIIESSLEGIVISNKEEIVKILLSETEKNAFKKALGILGTN